MFMVLVKSPSIHIPQAAAKERVAR